MIEQYFTIARKEKQNSKLTAKVLSHHTSSSAAPTILAFSSLDEASNHADSNSKPLALHLAVASFSRNIKCVRTEGNSSKEKKNKHKKIPEKKQKKVSELDRI